MGVLEWFDVPIVDLMDWVEAVDASGEEIEELNKELSQVDHVMKLRKETTKASQAFNLSQKNVTELGKSFQISKRQTAQLNDEFMAFQAETDQLQKAIKSIKSQAMSWFGRLRIPV